MEGRVLKTGSRGKFLGKFRVNLLFFLFQSNPGGNSKLNVV